MLCITPPHGWRSRSSFTPRTPYANVNSPTFCAIWLSHAIRLVSSRAMKWPFASVLPVTLRAKPLAGCSMRSQTEASSKASPSAVTSTVALRGASRGIRRTPSVVASPSKTKEASVTRRLSLRGTIGPVVASVLVLPCSSTARTPMWYGVPSASGAPGVTVEDASVKAEVVLTTTGGDVPSSTTRTGVSPSVELKG